jgi:hypothetical protein
MLLPAHHTTIRTDSRVSFIFWIKASETKECLLLVQLLVTGLFTALKNKDIGFFVAFHESKYLHAL